MSQDRLTIVPVTMRAANAFVAEVHRHHGPVRGCKFSIGVMDSSDTLRGIAIVGRPVSRHRDDGLTAEVTRLATDGCPNACSALYAAAWRAARAMGYQRLGTYILATEPGTSLTAAGWQLVGATRPEGWNRKLRPRTDGLLVGKTLRLCRPLPHPFEGCGCERCNERREENALVRKALGWACKLCPHTVYDQAEAAS